LNRIFHVQPAREENVNRSVAKPAPIVDVVRNAAYQVGDPSKGRYSILLQDIKGKAVADGYSYRDKDRGAVVERAREQQNQYESLVTR
jgi:hypothetical protein